MFIFKKVYTGTALRSGYKEMTFRRIFATKIPKLKNMRRISLILALGTAVALTAGFQCGDCTTVDCDPGYLFVQFLSKTDDSDLFNNGTYRKDSLQLFVLAGDMTASDYSHQLYGWQSSTAPGPYFTIDQNASAYIFQFNSLERDTLRLSFTLTGEGDCCPETPVVTYGIYRGDTIVPDAGGYLILKK